MEDDLPDKILSRLGRAISEKKMRAISIIYLDYNLALLEQFDTNTKPLTTWKGRAYSNNKQLLIDILFDATKYKLVDVKVIKEHLGEDAEPSGRPVLSRGAVDVDSPLTDSELGRLALKMSWAEARGIAEIHLNYTKPELDCIKETHNTDPWFANYEVLVGWTNLSLDHQRKKLAEILYEAAEKDRLLDVRVIAQTLGVTKEMLGLPPDGAGGGDVTDGRQQQQQQLPPNSSSESVEYQRVPLDRSGEPESSGASAAGSTYTQSQHPDLTRDELKRKLAGTVFPVGQPMRMLPQTVLGDTNFDWLKMKEIQEITSKMSTKKSVVVAVLDTGIYEAHDELKGKILTNKSKYFQTDKSGNLMKHPPTEEDLKQDEFNHGTVVAGIIALNGPKNVKIINLKVTPKPVLIDPTKVRCPTNLRYAGKMSDTVEALLHIQKHLPEVDIINMSIGQKDLQDDRLDGILSDLSKNRILIAAAGNSGSVSSDTVTFPGKHPQVICVGGCDPDGNPTGSSSRGPEVEFLCPGEDVWSINSNTNKSTKKYFAVNGTSFAAPYACAVAAHVLVAMEAKIGVAFRNRLRNSLYMRYVFRSITVTTETGKKLAPYDKGFHDVQHLIKRCEGALKGNVVP